MSLMRSIPPTTPKFLTDFSGCNLDFEASNYGTLSDSSNKLSARVSVEGSVTSKGITAKVPTRSEGSLGNRLVYHHERGQGLLSLRG